MLHLIHPALVHFSVACLILGGVGEAWGLATQREALARWSGQLLIVGVVSLVPTIVSGYLAANTVELNAVGRELLGAHERNGLILLGLFVACLFWKAWWRGHLPQRQRKLYAAVLVAGVLLAAYSAWLGGQMVYGQGIGVLSP